MDDFDSFSTVVEDSKKDDFDSFSTVVDEPKKEPKGRGMGAELMRQLGLTARAGIAGVTKAVSFPVNATASAVAGAANLAGAKDAARYIESNFGMEGANKAAAKLTSALPQPENQLEKIVGAGAEAMAGGVSNGVRGLSVMPGTATAGGMVLDGTVGAAMEASPGATLGVGGALAASVLAAKGAKGTKDYLRNRGIDKVVKKLESSPTPDVDATVIKNLAKDAQDPLRTNPMNGKTATQTASSLNEAAKDYTAEVKLQLKAGGIKRDDLNALMQKNEPSLAEIDAVRGTPEGDAVADAMLLKVRTAMLTKPKQSGKLTGLLRSAVDFAPIPKIMADPLKRALFSRETREEAVQGLIRPKNVAAADKLLAQNTDEVPQHVQSMNALKDLVAQRQVAIAAKKAAKVTAVKKEKTHDVGSTPLGKLVSNPKNEEVDKAYAMQFGEPVDNLATLADTPKPVPQPLPEDAGILSSIAKAKEDIDEFDLTGFNKGASIKAEVSNLLLPGKQKKEAEKAAAKAARQAEADAEVAGAGALTGQHGKTVNGGSLHETYKRLETDYGIGRDAADKLIKEMHEASDDVAKGNLDKLTGNKKFMNKRAFYDTQDSIVKFAESKGFSRKDGALTQGTPDGALSGPKTDAAGNPLKSEFLYKRKIEAIQRAYDQAADDFQKSDLPLNVIQDAVATVKTLKLEGSSAARAKAIADLYAKHPEYKSNLNGVLRDFK